MSTEPMGCDLPLSSPPPLFPPVLPDIADFGMMTALIQNFSVSCYTDSLENFEFSVLFKKKWTCRNSWAGFDWHSKTVGCTNALVHRLEIACQKQKQTYEDTVRLLEEKVRQKRLDDRKLADLKDTISDLRTQVAKLTADRQALPLLHQLLQQLTAPGLACKDKVTTTKFLYTVLAADHQTSNSDLKKSYHQLMRLCRPNRNHGPDRNISQQLEVIHNILVDPTTHIIYDCCGIRAVTLKDTTHFCRLGNLRPQYESLDDLWQWLLVSPTLPRSLFNHAWTHSYQMSAI